jgi:hypothetical protein
MRTNRALLSLAILTIPLMQFGPMSIASAQTPGGPCWTVPDLRVVNGSVVSSNKQLCAPANRHDCFLVPVIVAGGAGQRVICPPRPGCRLVNKIANNTAYWDFQC